MEKIRLYRKRIVKWASASLSVVPIIFLVVVKSTNAFADNEADQDIAFVEIANYKEIVEYKISLPEGPATLVAAHQYTEGQNDRLGILVESIVAKQRASKQAAASIKDSDGQSIKWAKFSPDNRLVLAGFEDPSLSALTSATVYKTSDLKAIMQMKMDGRIRDSLWSANSKSLIILESTERMKKSPWGLLLALSGHPIEINTFNLRLINIDYKSDVRISIPGDYENPDAELRSQSWSIGKEE